MCHFAVVVTLSQRDFAANKNKDLFEVRIQRHAQWLSVRVGSVATAATTAHS
jgi:hypothetical protein